MWFWNRHLSNALVEVLELLGNAARDGLVKFGCLLIMLSGSIVVELSESIHHSFYGFNPPDNGFGTGASGFCLFNFSHFLRRFSFLCCLRRCAASEIIG